MSLRKCGECGREVSDQAASCPQCGAPQKVAKKSNVGIGCLVAIGVVALLGVVGNMGGGSPGALSGGAKVIADLKPKRAQCQENVRQLLDLGGVKISDADSYTVAEYYGWNWSAFDHDDKIRQALLIYCAKMPDDGHWSVMIRDRQSGAKLGSVVDGNYFD